MNIKSFHWIYRKKWIILTGCAVGYSLAYYKCKSNNEEFIKSYELSRDTSRPGYKSYGMNFGFKTDKTVKLMQIEEMLDTGDILLMEHKCEKAFKINEMRYCYTHKLYKSIRRSLSVQDSNWDSAGILLREKDGPRVVFQFFNKIYDLEYDEFLRIPFFQDVGLRTLKTDNLATGFVSREFRAHIYNRFEEKNISMITGVFENGVDIIYNYWIKSGLADSENKDIPTRLEDIDTYKPKALKGNIANYSAPIIIRTKMSKSDSTNY